MKIKVLQKLSVLFVFLPLFSVGSDCSNCDRGNVIDCAISFDGNRVFLPVIRQEACRVSVVASYGESKINHCRRTFDGMLLLVDSSVSEISSNNGSLSVSQYSSGAKIDYKEKLDEAYEQAIELAVKYGDNKAEAGLKEAKKRHLDYALKYETNQDSIELKVEAAGHGWALDRKRGWEDAVAYANVVCVLPQDLSEQLRSKYGLKNDYVEIKNASENYLYIEYLVVDDPSLRCDAGGGSPVVVKLWPGKSDSFRVPVSPGRIGKACVNFHAEKPKKSDFSKSCEYSPGVVDEVASLPKICSS